MAKANLTKNYIAQVFQDLLKTDSYENVTIQRIAKEADISRKTFYYHFTNKTDLIIYIFRSGLAKELQDTFEESELICDTKLEDDRYRTYPFFTNGSISKHDKGAFFFAFSHYVQQNDAYYRKLYQGGDWRYLETYVIDIYKPQLTKTILEFFDEFNVEPPAEDIEYLAAYYAYSTVLWVLHRHVTKQHHFSDATKHRLENLFYDNIHNSVEIQAKRLLKQH